MVLEEKWKQKGAVVKLPPFVQDVVYLVVVGLTAAMASRVSTDASVVYSEESAAGCWGAIWIISSVTVGAHGRVTAVCDVACHAFAVKVFSSVSVSEVSTTSGEVIGCSAASSCGITA